MKKKNPSELSGHRKQKLSVHQPFIMEGHQNSTQSLM